MSPKRKEINADPVSAVDIARRLGMSRMTVNKWHVRPSTAATYPPHRWMVGNRPTWDWSDIVAWLKATGRPHERVDE